MMNIYVVIVCTAMTTRSILEQIDAELYARKRQLGAILRNTNGFIRGNGGDGGKGDDGSKEAINWDLVREVGDGPCDFSQGHIYLYPVDQLSANSGVVLSVNDKYAIHVLFLFLQYKYGKFKSFPIRYEATLVELRWMWFGCGSELRLDGHRYEEFVSKLSLIRSLGSRLTTTDNFPKVLSDIEMNKFFGRIEVHISSIVNLP